MEWKISKDPVDYETAVHTMEKRVRAIRAGEEDELVWLLEHPPLYTAGTSAKESDLLDNHSFPVYKTGRGGQYTYHGPGQRVAYVMLDLKSRTPDVRWFVHKLAESVIMTLAKFGVKGETREDRVGVWVREEAANGKWRIKGRGAKGKDSEKNVPLATGFSHLNTKEAKIAAIGVRIKQWVTYHGIAINIDPDLSHYKGIIPCGIQEYGITSLRGLGIATAMEEFDTEYMKSVNKIFTKTVL